MSRADDIIAYFETLYGVGDRGHIALFSRGSGRARTQVIPYSDRSVAAAILANQRESEHLYASWALHDEIAYKEQTRRQGTALVVPGLALDIDLGTGVHAAANLPSTPEEALELLSSTPLPPPSLVVHSGGGLYPAWIFEHPFVIEQESDRNAIADLWRTWGQVAADAWVAKGLKLDTEVCELARVFRVPGGLNPKTQPAQPVVMLHPFNGVRYAVADLQRRIAHRHPHHLARQDKQTELVADQLVRGGFDSASSEQATALKGLQSMFTGCRFLADCNENASALTEPTWKDLADVLAHVPQGDDLFHRLSARDQRYDHREAQTKLDRAKDFRPKRCETIASRCAECHKCPFLHNPSIGSPIRLASIEPELVELQRHYILDAKTGLFFNPDEGIDKTKDDFDRSYSQRLSKGLAGTVFQKSRTSLIVDRHDFLIGNPDLIATDGRTRTLNTWVDGGAPAAPGNSSIWLEEHLSYLIPEATIRRWVLQYMAHLVQRPGIKIRSGIMIQSPPGAGKNLFAQLFAHMFHERDVRTCLAESLAPGGRPGWGTRGFSFSMSCRSTSSRPPSTC